MKYLLPLLFLLLTGCTPLLVKEPVGENFTKTELDKFEGSWVLQNEDKEPAVIQLKKIDNEGRFQSAYVKWDDENNEFSIESSEIILKKGNKYGILHLFDNNKEENPEGLIVITLFEIKSDGHIVYWNTESEVAEAFLESGILRTESIDDDLVIVDESQKVIEILESKHKEIFDLDSIVELTKIVNLSE